MKNNRSVNQSSNNIRIPAKINPTDNNSRKKGSLQALTLDCLVEVMRSKNLSTITKGSDSITITISPSIYKNCDDLSENIKNSNKDIIIDVELTHDLIRTIRNENERYDFKMGEGNLEITDTMPDPNQFEFTKPYLLVKENYKDARWRLFHKNYRNEIEELVIEKDDELFNILKNKKSTSTLTSEDKARIADAIIHKKTYKDAIYVVSKIDEKLKALESIPKDLSQYHNTCLLIKENEKSPWYFMYVNPNGEVRRLPLPDALDRKKKTIQDLNELDKKKIQDSNLLIGKGNYSTIYKVEGKLVQANVFAPQEFKSKNLIINQEKPIPVKKKVSREFALEQSRIVRTVRYLHAKPVYFSPLQTITVMKYLEGAPLSDLLIGRGLPQHLKKPLSARNRVQIALQILRTQKHLYNLYILHGDIKPENLILSTQSKTNSQVKDRLKTRPIDFNISLSFDPSERQLVLSGGTPAYSAPEIINKRYISKESDLTSLGFTLMHLFDYKGFDINNIQKHTKAQIERAHFGRDFTPHRGDFEGLEGLSEIQQKDLMGQFYKMLEYQPNQRGSIDDAIKIFEKIELQLQLEDKQLTPESNQGQSLSTAYNLACEIKNALVGVNSTQEIKNILNDNLSNQQLNDENFPIFIETLEIKAFRDCKNIPEVIKKTNNLIDSFDNNINKLKSLTAEVHNYILLGHHIHSPNHEFYKQLTDLVDLYYDALKLQDKGSRYTRSIDDINAFNKKLELGLKKLETASESLRTTMEKVLVTNLSTSQANDVIITNLDYQPHYSPLKKEIRNLIMEYLFHAQDVFNDNNPTTLLLSKIVSRLLLDHESSDKLTQQKNKMKLSILQYMNENFGKNIKSKTRAASDRRLQDVMDLLTIINKASNKEELLSNTKTRSQTIHGGISHILSSIGLGNLYTGSSLKRNILKTANDIETEQPNNVLNRDSLKH